MQPETVRIASFRGMSGVFVSVLWHQTGAQHSAGANTSAVVEVCKVSNEVPQLVPASFLTSATREDTFCFSLCKWFLYVRPLSRVVPRYEGYCSLFRIVEKFCSKMITSIIRYHTAIHYIMSITRDRFRPYWVSSGGCKKHSIINMLKKTNLPLGAKKRKMQCKTI